jgi:hypothetical protein
VAAVNGPTIGDDGGLHEVATGSATATGSEGGSGGYDPAMGSVGVLYHGTIVSASEEGDAMLSLPSIMISGLNCFAEQSRVYIIALKPALKSRTIEATRTRPPHRHHQPGEQQLFVRALGKVVSEFLSVSHDYRHYSAPNRAAARYREILPFQRRETPWLRSYNYRPIVSCTSVAVWCRRQKFKGGHFGTRSRHCILRDCHTLCS